MSVQPKVISKTVSSAEHITFAKDVLLIVGFALLTGLAAQIKVPLPGTPVPMTFQTSIVLLSGLFLGARKGFLSQVLYAALGFAGLPFFAAIGQGTVGYIAGFALCAAATGASRNFCRGSFARTWFVGFAASFIILFTGMLYLKAFWNLSWMQALSAGVVPFLVGDVLKVTAASLVYRLSNR